MKFFYTKNGIAEKNFRKKTQEFHRNFLGSSLGISQDIPRKFLGISWVFIWNIFSRCLIFLYEKIPVQEFPRKFLGSSLGNSQEFPRNFLGKTQIFPRKFLGNASAKPQYPRTGEGGIGHLFEPNLIVPVNCHFFRKKAVKFVSFWNFSKMLV